MDQRVGIRQPLLGIVSFFIVLFIAFGIIVWFKTETFLSWAGFLAMTLIPFSIIIGLVWQSNYPAPAAQLTQPLRGVYLLLINMMGGALVAAWSLKTVGGFVVPPTPFLVFFTIMTVIMTFWCVVVWQCWPAAGIKGHPAFVGFGTLIVSYAVAWILFKTLFDFGFAKGAPFYSAALDPAGVFNAWVVLSWFLTALAVILAFVELDFWPFSSIAAKSPGLAKQPLWGIAVSIAVIIIASIVQSIFVRGLAMDVVSYMVKVPICIIFGQFIMLLLMQTAPVQAVRQPGKGVVLIVVSIILAVVMYYLYSWFSYLVTGGVPSGPPAYILELWLATALLSFTFPVIAIYTGHFNYWPLTEPAPGAAAKNESVSKAAA
jgi:hypothetical protein